ncbi:MAG: ABC transporter permease [Bacillota bacterium]
MSAGKVAAVFSGDPFLRKLYLLADEERGPEMTAVVHVLNLALIKAYSKQRVPQISLAFTNTGAPLRWLSYPGWLIQIILTICLLQAATAIADEKERSLSSLLVSPATWVDYLSSKLIWNTALSTAVLILTTLLTGAPLKFGTLLVFGILGSMVYTIGSLLIGLRSPNPLFARALATLAYIVSALPLMVKNLDFTAKSGLKVFPSYLILLGMEQALDSSPGAYLGFYSLILIIEAALLFGVSYAALKRADY